jgi:hypothetical protein
MEFLNECPNYDIDSSSSISNGLANFKTEKKEPFK